MRLMAFQIHKLVPFPCVLCFCSVLLVLLVCSPLPCCSQAKSYAINSATPSNSNLHNSVPGDEPPFLPGLLSNLQSSRFAPNMSDTTAFYIPEFRPGNIGFGFTSFNISFTLSIYQLSNLQAKANSSLVFAIRPADDHYPTYSCPINSYLDLSNDPCSFKHLCRCPFDEPPSHNSMFPFQLTPSDPEPTYDAAAASSRAAASNVSVQISKLVNGTLFISAQIDIDPPAPGNHSSSSVVNRYRVKISYNDPESLMSVRVTGDGVRRPVDAIERIQTGGMPALSAASMGLFSSRGQLLQLGKWNWEIINDDHQSYPVSSDGYPSDDSSQQDSNLTVILPSVLGSAAAIALTAAAVHLYMNSKYRRWKTEQDKIVKTMRSLPGVPTQVDYADIRKATKSFDQAMRLGKGGFGAVYRCTLPAAASRTGQPMEVAVKKFLREVEQRRYDDFLAEVSIINRLRHKNIVPLIGWSYNKGEPILIYEYMTNGSLDQHLFSKGGTVQRQQQQEEASIGKWQTRYSIAKGIAIGLHYVHHEHEPVVLHRDIKASNIMLDSTFRARLGDFGIASTVAVDRSSVTGIAGTWGYIAPEYAMTYRSTRQTDTYAFGVLIIEVVTGKKNGDVQPDDDHITDWVWRLHQEGKLLEAVDGSVLAAGDDDDHRRDDDAIEEEAERLLLLGLACTNPNPSNRPSMAEVVQVITKLAPPPGVPLEKPTFMWPPEDWRTRNSVYSTALSNCDGSSASTVEMVQVSQVDNPLLAAQCSSTGGQPSNDSTVASV